jgi:hypothetical protein
MAKTSAAARPRQHVGHKPSELAGELRANIHV